MIEVLATYNDNALEEAQHSKCVHFKKCNVHHILQGIPAC